jgi:hypothetical protein
VPVAVVVTGLAILLVGARARRPVAVVGAAALGAVSAAWLGPGVPALAAMSGPALAAAAGLVAGALAAAIPQVFPMLAGALPGALLGDLLAPDGRRLEAVAAGALLGALVGLLAARWVASATAAGVGALLFAIGGAGLLRDTGLGRSVVRHPVSILAVATVLAVAGAAFQLSRAWGRGGGDKPGKAPPAPAPVKGEAADG